MIPTGLGFVTGANALYRHDESGTISALSYDKKEEKYSHDYRGTEPGETLRDYADKMAETVEYWKSDLEEVESERSPASKAKTVKP